MLHDRRVHSIQQIETTDDIELPSRGSGGTCFSEALMTPSTFDEAPLVLFMITDGFCAVNARDQPDFPVVWVITPNGNTQFEPTFGDVVMM
jgi:predicted metal-dependent peptidase